MDIFGKFASREELLGAVEEAILCEKETVGAEGGAPREEERFFLKNDAAAAAWRVLVYLLFWLIPTLAARLMLRK